MLVRIIQVEYRGEMWLKAFLSPCSLHCCQPWCCSFPSASLSPSPQTLRPDRWAKRLHLRRETPHPHISEAHSGYYPIDQRRAVTVRTSYLRTYRWEPPPLWRFPGGAASVWRCEPFSSPVTETEIELRSHRAITTTPRCPAQSAIHTSMRFLAWKTSEIS